MSSFELHSNPHENPYRTAVRSFLNILRERFPPTAEIATISSIVTENLRDDYSFLLNETQNNCSLLLRLGEESAVPLRDKHLLALSFRKLEDLARILWSPALAVEKAFHEAYLDSTEDERSQLFLLAELRDQVFHSETEISTVKDFLESLDLLVESRKTRGWPSWENLEPHRAALVGICESLVAS